VKHQQRRSERRRFLLKTTGIAENEIRITHSADEFSVAARAYKIDTVDSRPEAAAFAAQHAH
jgi:hypothetical protein